MMSAMKGWAFALVVIFSVLLSWSIPRGESERAFLSFSSHEPLVKVVSLASADGGQDFFMEMTDSVATNIEYDFYRDTCPEAETIVRSTMAQIYSQHKNVSAQLLRLFFHDCFIQGCDASVLLDHSNGNKNHSVEKQAVPYKTLKGFDKIDQIKEVLENVCPAVVSCADILALATRDGVVLAGGPFYPLVTGRRDSARSYYDEAMAEIPKPDDNITQTLHLFSLRGFTDRETVSLLGGHNIGKIGCEFIQSRLHNFRGTGNPDPTVSPSFFNEMRVFCEDNGNRKSSQGSPMASPMASSTASPMASSTAAPMAASIASSPMASRGMSEKPAGRGMPYFQQLSSSVSSGAGFDTHYYQSLLRGRGLLFADQQLMANERTARLVRAYASDDGSTFRMDFARAMMKMSNLNVLTGSQGQVRLECTLPVSS
ncbi:putative Peroxidase 48 [Prunus yedoensis var. nudiflora]|uniref:peroxidase n=1 Tax=Prunus yedoensis var. nudiflora TaxID=2094558 RepID=A0A314XFU6_PRUYE|nr:putative Peroxidase 48 [Prunus yedoensis var. nudiflora]